MTIQAPQPPQSFGNYLTLADAFQEIGAACVAGWSKGDRPQLLQPTPPQNEGDAWERCSQAARRLKHWLIGNQIAAYGRDHEGAWFPLEARRTSTPYFDIDIATSQFRWRPDEWDVIFVDRKMLLAQIASTRKARPRKVQVFEWQKVASIAWKMTLEMQPPRQRATLISTILLRCQDELGCEPGEKELAPVLDDILAHLGERGLSREV
jgi:hypothetical protein